MLGSAEEAEDTVQDAYPRWSARTARSGGRPPGSRRWSRTSVPTGSPRPGRSASGTRGRGCPSPCSPLTAPSAPRACGTAGN
ncbi:hypothetical protein [Streptomyces sp. NBC_00145]|uniref:hypothetical protein n=1 Tax=Streptomyces sp. NBC_00145 TaxID=2975666 RepID=UPI003FA74D24